MTIIVLGIDLAKSVFDLHGMGQSGKPELVRHAVRLMAPKFVAPYRLGGRRGKNDAAQERVAHSRQIP